MLPVLAKPPPGLKVDQDDVADPPPGLKVDEPSPAPAKPASTKPAAPVTIDPGVDVGFGPGVAPPEISPETGMPVQAAKPAAEPAIAPPPPGLKVEEEPKPYVMTGVGALPEEPVKTFKPPVTDTTQAPVGQQLLGAGIAAALIPPGISQAAALLTGRRGMLPKPAIAEPPPGLKVEPEQKPAEQPLPSAVTALAAPNDPDATGKTTQAPDQSGNLQPAKFQYDDDTREKAIAEQTPDLQNLYLKAAQQLAADPNNPELIDRYIGAMMKYAKSEQPGFWESTGRLVGGAMQMILHSPEMIQNLDKVGVTTAQFGAILAKRAAGQEISPQDDAVLHTMLAYFEEGGGSFVEMADNIRNELAKHPAPSLFGPPAVPTDPNMMSWSDINKLPPDQREAVLRSKIQWRAQRYQNEQARQQGQLDPFWTSYFQNLTGHDPNTVAALAAHGIHVETGSIPTGGMVYNPGNILFPAGEAILGEGPLTKLLADVGDISADAIKGTGWIQQQTIERVAPRVGRVLGRAAGYATAKATVMAPLHAIGIPPWMSGWIPVGKTAGRIGAGIGERLGQAPQWLRENWWEPYADLIKTGAQDFRDGTNNLLANGGSLAPALVNIPGGAIKGALIAAPFAAGAETPEEVGSTLAFGGLLGGAHEAPLATRDAMFGSVFFRDPSRYPTGNAPKIDYGTNFGGMPLDHASNAFYVNQDRISQQRINDLRARFPNVEIHFLSDADYQAAVAHLQKTINPATNQSFLPGGNQRTRGLNVVTDPGTGRALVLVNGDSGNRMFDVGAHEIAHSVYRQMSSQEKLLWKNIGAQSNDINALTQRYTRNTTGGTGYNYTDLPTEAQIKAGTRKYLPGLDGLTQEKMHEELGAETVAALLRGQPIDSFTRNERLIRLAQLGLGRIANTLGIDVTPEEATTILGFKPSMAHMWMMNKVLRDYLRKNPSNIPGPSAGGGGGPGPTTGPKGRKAATGGPTGGPAQRPTPPPTGGPPPPPQPTPVPHTNNQPEIGGGSTGATTEEINKAVQGLQSLGIKKAQAQALVNAATGQTADELIHNALRIHGKTAAGFEQKTFRTPEEVQQEQAPILPHPLASHRLMQTAELTRRATLGDQQAVQALIERHGVDWLEQAQKEDPDAAAMYRRKYPDQAAEQDARIKAREAVRTQAVAEGKPEPKVVDGNRINELRQQAEREVSQRVKNRDVAVARRHLQLVMEEHNASLPSGDTRVRAKVDPETGRTVYYGTHFDPINDRVHHWLLSGMHPEERKFMMRAQDAIANGSSMNFNYTHAARIEPGEELPTGPEREEEYEAQTAKERAAGKVEGQVGNRTALPISVGVGADGQGLVYTMATDKVIANAIKSIAAMRSAKMTPPYTPDRGGMLEMQDDMRRVSQNHAAGYSGDGSKALVGTRDRPIVRDANYVPQAVPEDRAQFINMVMNARDPIAGPRVTKAGRTTAAGKAVEFAEANQGYTSPIVSHGQERVEVNPLRKELERRGAFQGRELEHGYEQFRGDLMRERDEAAPALRKHGIEAKEFTAAPERRIATAGFMPMIGEEPLAHTKADGDYFKELERLRAAGDLDKFADLRNAGPPDGNSIPSIYLHLFSRRENGAAVKNLDTGEIKAAPAHFEALYKHPQGEDIRGRLGTVFYDGTFHPEMRGGKETSTKGEEVVGPEASQGTTPAEWRQKNLAEGRLAAAGFMPEIPEEVRLRGAGAEKGKEQVRLRYDGAPPGVKDARSLRKLKDRLLQMALEGEAFRHWYTEGAEPMMRGVGNDPRRFEQLMANIAATSPQNKVYPNFGMAVRGLAQQEAGGRRITIGKGTMKQRLSEIGQGNIWEGVKINQFYRDHMAVFDKRLADDMGSTMDMHMARAFGYPTDSFTPKQSQWAQGIIRELTEELGWGKPKETQAAIWSAIKGRFETVWPDIYADAKANGDIITHVTKSGFEKSAFKDAATELKYRNRALKEAMNIPPPDLSEAAFNFGDALKRDLGAISYETRPSSTIQDQNPWMKQMTPQDWDEYHRQQAAVLLDLDGTNKLAKLANLISIGEHQGYSAWGSERNLSQQLAAVMPKAAGKILERTGEKWKVDPTIEKEVRDFAAAVGLLYQQDGVGYHRPYFEDNATWNDTNAFRYNEGRSLSAEETKAFVDNLEKLVPSYESDKKGWFVAPDEQGLRIVSRGQADNKKFYNLVKQTISNTTPESSTGTIERFPTYGNLISNDWEENPNGEGYRRWLSARRRPDIQRLVDDTLRPQVQAINDSWRIRKSGETEGGQRAASPEEIGQQVGAMPEGPEAPRPRERAPPWMYPPLSPTGYAQQPEGQQLPAAASELAPSPEPEVRRGTMLPPLSPDQGPGQAPPWQQQRPAEQYPPSVETGDQTGVADFFRKRGDQPITSANDPRLTTINVGGQSWRVNQEAAPYFAGFLHELASAGAPIRSDGGWVYREKVGAAGISEHAFGGAIDLNQEGRDEVTPAFQSWIAAHPGALAAAENKWHIYGGERFGDLGHFEWGGVPRSGYAAGGPDQETRRRTGSASAAHIMREEGSSDVQNGIPEIFGFRQGQDSEYEALARARAAGDERQVERIAATGFVHRAIEAGSQQFNDPAIKAQIMSLAHMRGPAGARNILNAVATGKIDNRGGVDQLNPEAVQQINAMPKAEVLRRIRIAREVYDKAVFGQEFWGKYGNGLTNRYAREREFYGSMA